MTSRGGDWVRHGGGWVRGVSWLPGWGMGHARTSHAVGAGSVGREMCGHRQGPTAAVTHPYSPPPWSDSSLQPPWLQAGPTAAMTHRSGIPAQAPTACLTPIFLFSPLRTMTPFPSSSPSQESRNKEREQRAHSSTPTPRVQNVYRTYQLVLLGQHRLRARIPRLAMSHAVAVTLGGVEPPAAGFKPGNRLGLPV